MSSPASPANLTSAPDVAAPPSATRLLLRSAKVTLLVFALLLWPVLQPFVAVAAAGALVITVTDADRSGPIERAICSTLAALVLVGSLAVWLLTIPA